MTTDCGPLIVATTKKHVSSFYLYFLLMEAGMCSPIIQAMVSLYSSDG